MGRKRHKKHGFGSSSGGGSLLLGQAPAPRTNKRAASPDKRPGDDEDPDLECGICAELLDDARQAPCCGSLACCDCLDAAAKQSSTCPFCRAALEVGAGHVDVRMERRAANVVRKCPHDGCYFRGKRDALREHAKGCEQRPPSTVIAELRTQLGAARADAAEARTRQEKAERELQRLRALVSKWERGVLLDAFVGSGNCLETGTTHVCLGTLGVDGARMRWAAHDTEWLLSAEHIGSRPLKFFYGDEAMVTILKASGLVTVTGAAKLLQAYDVVHVHVLSPKRLADRYSFQLTAAVAKHVLPFTEAEFENRFVDTWRSFVVVVGKGQFPEPNR